MSVSPVTSIRAGVTSALAPNSQQLKNDLANAYNGVGAHYRDQGDSGLSLKSFMQALELDPSSTTARQNVGELSHLKGLESIANLDYDSAITHLDRAYHTYGGDSSYGTDLAEAYNLRGQLRTALGDVDDAIEDFETGITIDPTNTSLSANLSAAVV